MKIDRNRKIQEQIFDAQNEATFVCFSSHFFFCLQQVKSIKATDKQRGDMKIDINRKKNRAENFEITCKPIFDYLPPPSLPFSIYTEWRDTNTERGKQRAM